MAPHHVGVRPAGTISTVTDLLGRTVKYTDAAGTVTTTGYDHAGRDVSDATTGAGGGASRVTTSYLDDGRMGSVTVDGSVVAQLGYDTAGELSGVVYPTGTGNGGSGMSVGGLTKTAGGSPTGMTCTLPGSHTVTDTVTRSQADRVMTDTAAVDGATVGAWGYSYDPAARLTQAVLAAVGACPTVTLGYIGQNWAKRPIVAGCTRRGL